MRVVGSYWVIEVAWNNLRPSRIVTTKCEADRAGIATEKPYKRTRSLRDRLEMTETTEPTVWEQLEWVNRPEAKLREACWFWGRRIFGNEKEASPKSAQRFFINSPTEARGLLTRKVETEIPPFGSLEALGIFVLIQPQPGAAFAKLLWCA
jgi:hypothetical protein